MENNKSKNIIIAGGGISGLTMLHYLKKKYADRPDVHIRLFEAQGRLGGKIFSEINQHGLFEYAASGFLNAEDSTRNLALELGLESELIQADPQAKLRYLSLMHKLHPFPTQPFGLLKFAPLSFLEKMRIFQEIFVNRGNDPDESIYDFGKRRFGQPFAEYFLDPMVSGIFGGDIRQLHLKSVFPKIAELEQTHGSLIKAMFKLKKKKNSPKSVGQPKGSLTSFKKGMFQLIQALENHYQEFIQNSEAVEQIEPVKDGYKIQSKKAEYLADEIYICTAAKEAAQLVLNLSIQLADLLRKITYVPIAVVGLVYERSSLTQIPKGFGYLIPSSQNQKVLGVLFSTNIFPQQFGSDRFFFTIMSGGAHHPQVSSATREQLIDTAKKEIQSTLGLNQEPVETRCVLWRNAIPQYNLDYPQIKESILKILRNLKNFHLVANYLEGVSVNNCVSHARLVAEKSSL